VITDSKEFRRLAEDSIEFIMAPKGTACFRSIRQTSARLRRIQQHYCRNTKWLIQSTNQ